MPVYKACWPATLPTARAALSAGEYTPNPQILNTLYVWGNTYSRCMCVFIYYQDPRGGVCGKDPSNEIWMFGNASYNAIRRVMGIREQIRPYVMEQYRAASVNGTPMMRCSSTGTTTPRL